MCLHQKKRKLQVDRIRKQLHCYVMHRAQCGYLKVYISGVQCKWSHSSLKGSKSARYIKQGQKKRNQSISSTELQTDNNHLRLACQSIACICILYFVCSHRFIKVNVSSFFLARDPYIGTDCCRKICASFYVYLCFCFHLLVFCMSVRDFFPRLSCVCLYRNVDGTEIKQIAVLCTCVYVTPCIARCMLEGEG